MPVHIIIDGYNLIRQSFRWSMLDARDMQLGREALLRDLAEYKRRKAHRITVVFDAADAPEFTQKNDKVQGVSVTYSRPGESADTVIKRLAARLRENALVVSSDRDVTGFASRQGAGIISSPDFERRVMEAAYDLAPDSDGEDGKEWDVTTRKKGPERRLPKQQRRNLSKIRKL